MEGPICLFLLQFVFFSSQSDPFWWSLIKIMQAAACLFIQDVSTQLFDPSKASKLVFFSFSHSGSHLSSLLSIPLSCHYRILSSSITTTIMPHPENYTIKLKTPEQIRQGAIDLAMGQQVCWLGFLKPHSWCTILLKENKDTGDKERRSSLSQDSHQSPQLQMLRSILWNQPDTQYVFIEHNNFSY